MTREEMMMEVATTADLLWQGFDRNERTGVRFGMLPAVKVQPEIDRMIVCGVRSGEAHRLLSVALMDCAKRDGGMRA